MSTIQLHTYSILQSQRHLTYMSLGCQRETMQMQEILHTFYREAGTTLPLQSKDRDVKKSIYPCFFLHIHTDQTWRQDLGELKI